MVELKQIDNTEVSNTNLPDNVIKIYSINDNIGYIYILDSDINKIFIYVKEEYQGKGFGTKSFSEILKEFKGELIFETDNPIVKRMIIRAGGIDVGTSSGVTRLKLFVY